MFSDKLNFLIDLTRTKNSELAMAASMDASNVSRLRNGNRKLSKHPSYIMPMSRFFAKHLVEPFMQNLLADAMHLPGEWPKDNAAAAELISRWLTADDSEADLHTTSRTDFFHKKSHAAEYLSYSVPETLLEKNISFLSDYCYYGVEGKQKAILRFLISVCQEDTVQTLLLFSDEEISWLYEDPVFTKEWSRLLTAVLQKGNRIKIIHTISRDSGEMMEALLRWLPVYMTGSIEPYYYPKLRDGVFQRTLFIAPRTGAIVSNSVKGNTSEMLNLYIAVPDGIKALTTEFERYLSLCRPLFHILNATNSERYFREASDLEKISAPSITFSRVPSLMSMPESLVSSFSKKTSMLKKRWKEATKQLALITEQAEFYEILIPPTKEQLSANLIPLPMNDFYLSEQFFYTVKQYKEHLEHIQRLMEDIPHYHVLVSSENMRDIMLFIKEDVGGIISRSFSPTIAFSFRESNMTAAFWSFLQKQLVSLMKENKHGESHSLSALIRSL